METLVIDGNNLFTIGFFGRKELYHKQQHIGGIFHFLDTIRRHLQEYRYDKVVVFWDGDDNIALRKSIYPYYKENRKIRVLTEQEEYSKEFQRVRVKQYLEELFVRQGEFERVESDDCIAFYCHNTPNERKTIFTGDKDLMQLISEDIKIYNANTYSFNTLANKVAFTAAKEKIEVPAYNVALVKILCGDSSDNVAGIKGMGLKTLVGMVPKITESYTTLEEVLQVGEGLLTENKQSKVLQHLLSGTSKYGVFGQEFFDINRKIVDLKNPILTEEAKDGITLLIHEPLNPDDRGWKNVIKMMVQDGLNKYLPQKDNQWTQWLKPLLDLARKEKKYFNNK